MSLVPGTELLLVEDNENDVELTLRALKGINLLNRVHVAKDGEEALSYIFRQNKDGTRGVANLPRAMLVDLKLPKVSGLELIGIMKSDKRTAAVPLIVLTSSRETADLKKCYGMGVNSYIVKPYGLDDFIKAIASAGLYWVAVNQPYLEV